VSKELTWHTNTNDAIKGERIVIEARKFNKSHEISGKTSRHGASRIKADKAEAWVEQAYVVGANW
jgi:hypothetical protein